MKRKRIKVTLLVIVSIILTVSSGIYIGFLAYNMYKTFFIPAEGIGIIGGADGPTAIFLLARFGMFPMIAVIGLISGIICMIISWLLLLKKDK